MEGGSNAKRCSMEEGCCGVRLAVIRLTLPSLTGVLATTTLFLQLDNDWNGPLTIRIVDVLGRTAKRVETVKNVGLWELSVNVEDLQTGIYQVLVSDGERMAIRKWVRM